MIVVADTSPINYLILIGQIELLAQLFSQVFVPQAVIDELNHERAPEAVRQWVATPPAWAKIHSVSNVDDTLKLGRGEREAIALAQQLGADLLLLDDWKAWKAAEARGLAVIGTLNVLEKASQNGIVNLAQAFDQLRHTTFHVTPELFQRILDRQATLSSKRP